MILIVVVRNDTQYFNMNSTFREKLENAQKELDIALEENEALKSEKEEQV